MCEVTTAMAVIGVAGSLMGGINSYQSAQASASAAEYQSDIYRQNASIAQNNAITERQAGIDEARRIKLQTLSNISSQNVAMAANGIDIGEGSALDLTDSTKFYGEMDALTTYSNANSRASAFEAESQNYLAQAGMSSSVASNYKKSALLSGLGTTMTGLGQVGSSWYNYTKTSTSLPTKGGTKIKP